MVKIGEAVLWWLALCHCRAEIVYPDWSDREMAGADLYLNLLGAGICEGEWRRAE